MDDHQNFGYIFSFKPFWKTCFTVFCSFRDVYKIGIIWISVSDHVTFKSGELLFFILAPPIKARRRNAPAGLISTKIIPKHVSLIIASISVFLFSVK